VLEHVEEEPDGLVEPEIVRSLGTKLDPNGRKVCIVLGGCAGGVNACSIYPQRPRACRAFEVGGYFCKQARQQFGLPV
jgi:Fe-S-cluster containining protein